MSGRKVTRIGDSCSHGATVITGENIRTVDGKKVARRGDLVNCPLHGVNQIISTISGPVDTTTQKTSFLGSVAACGAIILTGSDLTSLDR
ncbi:MAG: PAAR domain-containing protein [Verrucomicrobiaceae bacterium]|nr:MAG: PAAR domain-containing protein [Verrucomicrobiaceae bacterium]